MKKSTLKILLLLSILINFSCSNDDNNCNDINLDIDFPINVKLVSLTGENLLSTNNFDITLLEITDLFNPDSEPLFSEITENGEQLITFQARGLDSVNFEYDGEDKFYFGFDEIQLETVNCVVTVESYLALRLNGDLFCDCRRGDVLVVPLDL